VSDGSAGASPYQKCPADRPLRHNAVPPVKFNFSTASQTPRLDTAMGFILSVINFYQLLSTFINFYQLYRYDTDHITYLAYDENTSISKVSSGKLRGSVKCWKERK